MEDSFLIDIIRDYLVSVKKSLDNVENKDHVIIDICFNLNQGLEKVDTNKISVGELRDKFRVILKEVFDYENWLRYSREQVL